MEIVLIVILLMVVVFIFGKLKRYKESEKTSVFEELVFMKDTKIYMKGQKLTMWGGMCYIFSMNKTATIHARIDPETKKKTESILSALGMSPTDAVRLLYRQIAIRNEFPLELRVFRNPHAWKRNPK